MNKEERKNFKEFEKNLQKSVREIAKTHGYGMASGVLFKRTKEFFISSMYYVSYNDGISFITLLLYIKTYEYDNLFWKIFDMEENIQCKDSLRANGAFVAPSFKFMEKRVEILDLNKIDGIAQNIVLKVENECERFMSKLDYDAKKFNSYILEQEGFLREKLVKCLIMIQQGNFQDASDIIRSEILKGERGGFQNKGKEIYAYIAEYCDEFLNEC